MFCTFQGLLFLFYLFTNVPSKNSLRDCSFEICTFSYFVPKRTKKENNSSRKEDGMLDAQWLKWAWKYFPQSSCPRFVGNHKLIKGMVSLFQCCVIKNIFNKRPRVRKGRNDAAILLSSEKSGSLIDVFRESPSTLNWVSGL